jgi:heat-inducible transcriptional repressor
MITERQENLLNFLIREYITTAEPVSSLALKKVSDLNVCAATIRNDLQELAEQGYIEQPHTSAGRVPTQKAYKYFSDKIEREKQRQFDDFIVRQIRFAHEEMAREMRMMQEIMQTLENDNLFDILNILDKWHKNNRI